MAPGACPGEDLPPQRDGAFSELPVELGVKFLRTGQAAGSPEIRRAGGQEKRLEIVEPILDRTEAGAIAPALADVQRRLSVVALRRIDRTQIGNVVEPALLGA